MQKNKKGSKTMELEQIAIRVNEISEQSCEGQIELGGLLIDAKGKVKHGQWKKWLDDNTNFSQSKANKLMKACKLVEVAKSYTFTNLDICKVFALTNLKEEIDVETFLQNFDLENMSVREIEKEVKLYNKELKKDEIETKKAAKKEDVSAKEYTRIETEIKVEGVTYYYLDEVCGVMGYKTQKDFISKYKDLVIQIKGNDCIKSDDFIKILANSKEKNLDNDSSKVIIELFSSESVSSKMFMASYKVKLKKGYGYELIHLSSVEIVKDNEYNGDVISKTVAESLSKIKVFDENTFNCTMSFILAHLETIKDEMFKAKENQDRSDKEFSDNWDKAFGLGGITQSNTMLDKVEYRKLVKVCHPDNGGSEELMNIISKLYQK